MTISAPRGIALVCDLQFTETTSRTYDEREFSLVDEALCLKPL